MNPLREVSAVLRRYPDVLLVVDAVSSLTGVKIPVDDLGLDVCLAGTQKAFALPPGMCVFTVSPRALERAARVKNRGYYFDFVEFKKYSD
jgi:aspartate aminotransferase-like enzyme